MAMEGKRAGSADLADEEPARTRQRQDDAQLVRISTGHRKLAVGPFPPRKKE